MRSDKDRKEKDEWKDLLFSSGAINTFNLCAQLFFTHEVLSTIQVFVQRGLDVITQYI